MIDYLVISKYVSSFDYDFFFGCEVKMTNGESSISLHFRDDVLGNVHWRKRDGC